MTVHILPKKIVLVWSQTFTLSGNVTVDSTPAERNILIYKNGSADAYGTTVSDSNGDWSHEVVGNANDKFRIVIVGESGEYSKIFEDVVRS